MKWVHYFLCFLGGVFLIHIVPHMLHGWSAKNAMGVAVSLGGGCLLLWAGRFRWRERGKVAMVVLGMIAVVAYGLHFANHMHTQ